MSKETRTDKERLAIAARQIDTAVKALKHYAKNAHDSGKAEYALGEIEYLDKNGLPKDKVLERALL